MLTPSAPFHVSIGTFASLRVSRFYVSAGQRRFFDAFDSRELHYGSRSGKGELLEAIDSRSQMAPNCTETTENGNRDQQ